MNSPTMRSDSPPDAKLATIRSPKPVAPLLLALGHPENDFGQPALASLHAGAAFHRLAMISEVVEAYRRDANLKTDEPAYLPLLLQPLAGEPPQTTAKRLYRTALRMDERFAEAWFNLARLLQAGGDVSGALVAFRRAAVLPPHPRAHANVQLHANAHWHMATLLEDAGRNDDALNHYREALARCDNFGVHHVRVANFMRRRGLLTEALTHYERLMAYSHRYFTEFVLPPLAPPSAALSTITPNIDALYETSDGFVVVFWDNTYHRLPKAALPLTPEMLNEAISAQNQIRMRMARANRMRRLLLKIDFRNKPTPIPHSYSIAEFEP